MSQPAAGKSTQGTQRSLSNQQSDTNTRSTAHVTIPPPQRDLTDLMRYTMGYPTFQPAENMGLPPNIGDLTGGAMGPPPRTMALNRVSRGSRTESVMPSRTESAYFRHTTTPNNNPTAATTSQVVTPTSTTRSTTRPSSSTDRTSRSENSLISSPQNSTLLGAENADGSKNGGASASGAKLSKPILPWR